MDPLALLQSIPEPLDTQAGKLLIALVVVAVIVVVGRTVLAIAWKLLLVAIVALTVLLIVGFVV